MIYDWAAVPKECFQKQGDQAIFLTLAANKVIEQQPSKDYWKAQREWVAGDIESVIAAQDFKVCQALNLPQGSTSKPG